MGPTANEAADRTRQAMDKTMDKGRDMLDKGRDMVGEGYEAASQMAGKGRDALQGGVEAVQKFASDTTLDDVRDFVRNYPWSAIAVAFGVGYLVAQVLQRVP